MMRIKLTLIFLIIFLAHQSVVGKDSFKFVNANDLFFHFKDDVERVKKTGFELSECLYLEIGLFERIQREFPGYLKKNKIEKADYERVRLEFGPHKQELFTVKLSKKYLSTIDVIKAHGIDLYSPFILFGDPKSKAYIDSKSNTYTNLRILYNKNRTLIANTYIDPKILYYKDKALVVYRDKNNAASSAYILQLIKPNSLRFEFVYAIEDYPRPTGCEAVEK